MKIMEWKYYREPPKTKEQRDSIVIDIVSSVALEFGILMEDSDFDKKNLRINFDKVPKDKIEEFARRLEEALGGIDDIVFEEDLMM